MNNEQEIIQNIIEKYDLDLGKNYIYGGATIIKRSIFPDKMEILYCEDGFNDENGIPYIMQSYVPNGVFERDRFIVFYTQDLHRYIVPTDGENWTLIGNDAPDEVKNINYGKAKKIIHRKALELKKEPEELTKEEVDGIYKKYIKNYKKGRMLAAGILSSFVWFLLIFFGMVFIFTNLNSENASDSLLIGILMGSVVLFIIGAIFITRFFIKIPARRLKSFVYKSDFLVLNYGRKINITGLKESYIKGVSYDEGICKSMSYGISHYDEVFIDGVEYFEIVTRYSKTKYPKNLEFCLFVRNKYL